MDNRERQKINYFELLRAIAGHWKPVFQDKQFRKAMLKCIVGTIAFTAFGIFMLSLNPTGEALLKLMEEIKPPQNAILIKSPGIRNGLVYYYKISGMRDEEVRLYYRKELIEKKWKYQKMDEYGDEWYIKSVYKDGYTSNFTIILQRRHTYTKPPLEYDWILGIYKD